MPRLIPPVERPGHPGRALLVLVALLLPAPGAAQATTIILARHAEKAAPSGDPELTPEGMRRAEALAQVVADVRLSAILTTHFRRTRLTAAPAGRAALGGPALPDLCDGEHATLFTLVRPAAGPPHLLRSRYGAAEPPGATACHAEP